MFTFDVNKVRELKCSCKDGSIFQVWHKDHSRGTGIFFSRDDAIDNAMQDPYHWK